MASHKSSKFFVGSIITFLIVFGIITMLLSVMQGIANKAVSPESMAAEDILERIKPVAKVHTGDAPVEPEPVVTATAPEAAAPTEESHGAKVVTQACAMCHTTGMMNSPKLGDADGWAPRIEKGIEVLYDHAINGLNMMPARGGRPDLSDDDVKAAVDHMLSLVK